MAAYELAQINIGRFRLPPDHVANRDFMDALDHVNAVAEAADGFVWRLTGDGNNATDVPVTDDPHLIRGGDRHVEVHEAPLPDPGG